MSWPRSASQIPINVGDPSYDPLFPYGFGLTYGHRLDASRPRSRGTRSPRPLSVASAPGE